MGYQILGSDFCLLSCPVPYTNLDIGIIGYSYLSVPKRKKGYAGVTHLSCIAWKVILSQTANDRHPTVRETSQICSNKGSQFFKGKGNWRKRSTRKLKSAFKVGKCTLKLSLVEVDWQEAELRNILLNDQKCYITYLSIYRPRKDRRMLVSKSYNLKNFE